MDQHDKALKILVYKLKDFTAAERYCQVNSKVCLPNSTEFGSPFIYVDYDFKVVFSVWSYYIIKIERVSTLLQFISYCQYSLAY